MSNRIIFAAAAALFAGNVLADNQHDNIMHSFKIMLEPQQISKEAPGAGDAAVRSYQAVFGNDFLETDCQPEKSVRKLVTKKPVS